MPPPLCNITIIEMSGLAPAPFAGLILSDFGANVIRIDRCKGINTDVLTRNKRSLALNLKKPEAIQLLLKLVEKADVILDPYRPGIMEKLGLGPDEVFQVNPRIIYARLSGFGQLGSQVAGHDINYSAISGALSMIGLQGEKPFFPLNLLADFAGGGLMCVMGILMAIIERTISDKGQIIDANLTAGTSYLITWPYLMQKFGLIFDGERGTNMLDGGAHFYDTYKTKDDQYMAVGAIEPQFYAELITKLGLKDKKDLPDQLDKEAWPQMKLLFQHIFSTKTQFEWIEIFDGSDACVTPVLSFKDPIPPNSTRKATMPQPAPLLSRTPAIKAVLQQEPFLKSGKHSIEILNEFGISRNYIESLLRAGIIIDASSSHL